jgi:AcrR family transcriptional regulator
MRKRILNAAMKLFLQKGYQNVTIRKIASEIGYSPGTIYRYFTDKDDLFFALRNEGFKRFYQAQLETRNIPDLGERLRAHGRAYADFALNNPEYYEIMFLMEAPMERASEKDDWSWTRSSFDLVREDIAAGMDAGILRKGSVEQFALAIWSLVHGTIALIRRRRFLLHTDLPDRVLVEQALEFLDQNAYLG